MLEGFEPSSGKIPVLTNCTAATKENNFYKKRIKQVFYLGSFFVLVNKPTGKVRLSIGSSEKDEELIALLFVNKASFIRFQEKTLRRKALVHGSNDGIP